MPVQIPKLDRFAPAAPQQETDLKVTPPDASKFVEGTTHEVNRLADAANNITRTFEDHALDTQALKIANDFEQNIRGGMESARKYEGDPTEVYSKLKDDWSKWREDALAKADEGDFRLRNKAEEYLNKVEYRQNDNLSANQAAQYAKYQSAVTTQGIKLRQESMIQAAMHVDASDKDSASALDPVVNDIEDLRNKYAAKVGLAVMDENGNLIKESEGLKLQRKKDISDGIKNVVKALNLMGKTEEAKMVLDRYQDRILDETKVDLLNDHRESVTKKRSYGLMSEALSKGGPKEAVEYLDNVKGYTPEEIEMSRGFLATRLRNNKQIIERVSNENFEKFAQAIRDAKDKGMTFTHPDDFKQDDLINAKFNSLSEKDKKAAERMAVPPKTSDPTARAAVVDLIADSQKLKETSSVDFDRMTAKLNDYDRKRYRKMYEDEKLDTPAEKRGNDLWATRELRNQMIASQFMLKKDGQWKIKGEKSAEAVEAQWHEELLERSSAWGQGMSRADIAKNVKQFVGEKLAQRNFKGATANKLQSSPAASPTPAPDQSPEAVNKRNAAIKEFNELPDKQAWADLYAKENNGIGWKRSDGAEKFMDFVHSKQGKK